MNIKVNPQTYPAVFRAFLEIDYDNGAVNRYEPESTEYDIPAGAVEPEILAKADSFFSALSPDDLNRFCTSSPDDDPRQVELLAMPGADSANALLNAYFNEWGEAA